MAELYWPFDSSIINYGFGYAPGYGGFHNGIDFPVPQGTELRATVSGTIRNNDAGARDGAGVDIATPDGWTVRMWHVSAFLVPNGSHVEAGQVIALSGGQPGTWGAGNATGPHLHWGVAIGRAGNDYNWIDPASLNPKSFNNPNPPQPIPKTGVADMIVKVQCADGFAAIWNMTTGAYQHIAHDEDWTYWTTHLQEFQFQNENHFRDIITRYQKVFSV